MQRTSLREPGLPNDSHARLAATHDGMTQPAAVLAWLSRRGALIALNCPGAFQPSQGELT